MKILDNIQLEKLTTERLLALYKKVRDTYKKLQKKVLTNEENDEMIRIMFYKDDIKKILNTRENIN